MAGGGCHPIFIKYLKKNLFSLWRETGPAVAVNTSDSRQKRRHGETGEFQWR